MITNTGKNIIAKYLLNQAPEFASHIAIGVGGKAASTASPVIFPSDSESLNFEVARVPILSKGLIKEDGVEKIVFKAQLPTDQRFQITEIGLYPSESNALAERYDSKVIVNFTNSETWTYSALGSASVVGYFGEIPILESGNINDEDIPDFSFMESDSKAFEFQERRIRNEQPRYLAKNLFIRGNLSSIDESFNVAASSYYLENNNLNVNMSKNLPTDKIKLAFSVLNKVLSDSSPGGYGIRFVVKFFNSTPGNPSATAGIVVDNSSLSDSRYQVAELNISDFIKETNFSWSNVTGVRIYTSVFSGEDYFVALDGLKLDNISTINPLYGLVAAEYIETQDELPALKRENSISYIEYRFGLGVSSISPFGIS